MGGDGEPATPIGGGAAEAELLPTGIQVIIMSDDTRGNIVEVDAAEQVGGRHFATPHHHPHHITPCITTPHITLITSLTAIPTRTDH